MKKIIFTLLIVFTFLSLAGCRLNKQTVDPNIKADITKIVDAKIEVANLVPATLKVERSSTVAMTHAPKMLTNNEMNTIQSYTKDELSVVQSEGFKIIDDHVKGIQEHIDKVYQLIDTYLENIDKVGQVITRNDATFIFDITDTGYSFYLTRTVGSNLHYLEIIIDIQDDESIYITARYEIEGISTVYIEFSEQYIKEIYILNNVMFRIGEFTKDELGNSTIKHYRENLATNRSFYLVAQGNETYGGLTRYHFDDVLNVNGQYTEIYNQNAELIFQSYQYDNQLTNLGQTGARWFLNNVDGWSTITDEQGDRTYNHTWTITGLDQQTYTMNNTLTDNILTRGYTIASEPFKRITRHFNNVELEQTTVLVLVMVENWLNEGETIFTLPAPFNNALANEIKLHAEQLENTYNTELLAGLSFKDITYEQAIILLPERNTNNYPVINQ